MHFDKADQLVNISQCMETVDIGIETVGWINRSPYLSQMGLPFLRVMQVKWRNLDYPVYILKMVAMDLEWDSEHLHVNIRLLHQLT